MSLLAPEVLNEGLRLSLPVLGCALSVGLLLWLLGSLGYRFWIVLTTTLLSGIVGLNYGPSVGMQPLVAGLLLAVATGMLALSLVRVGAFLVVGSAAVWLANRLAPTWDESVACFLGGGLLGVLLFRLWIASLTSFVGALLMLHAGLCLASRFGASDLLGWAERNGALLDWGVVAATVLGVLVQFLIQRRIKRKARRAARDEAIEAEFLPEVYPPPRPRQPEKRPSRWWFPWGRKEARRAG
jgi:hypothetical protein